MIIKKSFGPVEITWLSQSDITLLKTLIKLPKIQAHYRYSLRPVKSVHLEILGQIMELSKKYIEKVQTTISLLFN